MMKDTNLMTNCPLGETTLTYVYGELDLAAVAHFEDHLANCDICVDELAAVSQARFEVFDWRRVKFSPLATPRFEISDATIASAHSLFDRLRAGVSFSPTWGMAAVLIVFVGIAFAMVSMRPRANETAIVEPPDNLVERPSMTSVAEKLEIVGSLDRSTDGKKFGTAEVAAKHTEAKPVKGPTRVAAKSVRPVPAKAAQPVRSQLAGRTRSAAKPPRLNDFADEEDNTLRLTDLFDAVGSSD
ncbi:MAG: hypothetical protein LC730_03320 [Acidobacteria bacterium]|nr:hypothetical protein [Acidobacteriota bacterium]MCA1608474.1 hypothetical protein [Acidobacteriota bacterium]